VLKKLLICQRPPRPHLSVDQNFWLVLFFLVVEEETLALIHHLLGRLAVRLVFVLASVSGCWLVVADCTKAERLFF
jgi:hypothetical protein